MVGQRDNFSIDVQGTALDVLANTEQPGGSGFVVVGGANQLSVLTVGGPTMNAWTKLRSNRMLIRLLKFNPLGTGQFACVSGQFVDVYVLTQSTSQVQRIASFKAQAHKVSDFCWCPFDENLMMSCGENDSVSFWDLRTDLSSPSAQLGLTFGAVQSKFAPHLNNYLLTTNGTDGRLWDLRHTSQPISQFTAHQSKVLCLDWHPHHQEPNTFFTSANDNTLKLWNMNEQKSSPSLISVAPFSAWRLVFSQEGEELAAVSLPPANALALYSNYGLENPRLLKGIAKDAALMDAAWHKSTSVQKSTTKFLYTLSGNHILRRHAIAYELANELRDEMATPITQSKTDEERDRLVAVAAEQHSMSVDPELMQMAGGSLDEVDAAADTKVDAQQQQNRRFPTETRISSSTSRSILVGSLKNASISLGGGGTTPQSPIYSEWQHWIRAPNVVGGDLLTELEALRKPTTEGLYTTEVNFTRAAIGFSYMHLNRFPKINFEMRFHREFIENGLVFVEVVQKDSPFTADKASLFLTLLQQECDEQLRIPNSQQKTTILCRVLKQLPRIIDLMKVFTAASAMEVPNLSKTSSQSGSTGEEQILANLAATEFAPLLGLDSTGAVNRSISAAVPCSYVPSLYDHRVPAPRNCGARFNRSGYLVSFGPNNLIFPGRNNNRLEEMKEGGIPIPRIVPPAKRRTGVSRLGSARSQPSEGKMHHPRSLAEYCVLVNPTAPISLRQTSSTSSAPFQCSPPVRCASPGATWPKPVAADSSLPQDQQQQQNSLSPPSLLHQNLASLDGAGEMPSMLLLDSSLRGGQGRAFVGAGIRAVLGSSPNSASSAVRSYSLQNVAQSIRHRGSSMSGGIASTAAGATAANAAEPASATSVTTAKASTIMTAPFPQHQQSMIESGSTGPAAVMPEQSFNSVVVVYDATTLLPISQTLARTYKLLGPSPLDICRHNFEQAAKVGRKDLMSMWKLVEQCVRCPSAAAAFSRQNGHQSSINGKQIIGHHFAKLFRLEPNRIPRALESTAAFEIPWAVHPLGRELINRLLEYFASKFDLQTAAIITCVISDRDLHHNKVGSRPTHSSAEDNDKTTRIAQQQQQQQQQQLAVGGNQQQQQQILIASGYAADARPSLPTVQNLPPSRKVSASLSTTATIISTPGIGNRSFIADNFGSSRAKQQQQQQQSTTGRTDRLSPAPEHHLNYHSSSSPTPIPRQYPLPQREFGSELLLDPSLSVRFEEVRRKYADILLRWRMYKKCAEVLKHCATNNEENAIGTIKAISWCSFCGQQQRESSKCTRCRRPPIFCAICEQPCNGVVATCTSCSHGGHFMHIAKWFDAQFLCPLGCGCECKF